MDQNPALEEGCEANDQTARNLERNNLILVIAGAVAMGFFYNLRDVGSFLAGGCFTVVNLRLLRMIVKGLAAPERSSKGRMGLQIVVKYAGMLGLLAFLMLVVKPSSIPFLLGLSTVVVAVALEGLIGLFRRS